MTAYNACHAEIPLALPEATLAGTGVVLVDPVLALARALIREADSAKLKPLAPVNVDLTQGGEVAASGAPIELRHQDAEEWLDEDSLESLKTWEPQLVRWEPRLAEILLKQQSDIKELLHKMDALSLDQASLSSSFSRVLCESQSVAGGIHQHPQA